MNFLERLKSEEGFCIEHNMESVEIQKKSKMLCYKYNMCPPDDTQKKAEILGELLGDYNENVFIEPSFRCDYGFNIHFRGMAFINYNCVILDTSPVHIGNEVFIGPGVCVACAGHGMHPQQRAVIETSKPINIKDRVWIGANSTVCSGVTIGEGSIIGAGSVVNKDIPAGVVAAGSPCRVIRKITDKDMVILD